jgi:carbamoyl-phosphate synthase large subunit
MAAIMSLAALSTGVLITGVGAPPGLGMLRSLRQADAELRIAASDLNPLSGGLYEPGILRCELPSAADPEAYAAALLDLCQQNQLDIVIPGSEAEAAALAPLRDEWASLGIHLPLPDPDVIAFGIDKGLLLTRAAESDLPHPLSLQAEELSDLDSWPDRFPCVVKPRCSRGGRGVSYPADRRELRQIWQHTVRHHGPSVVQELIPGGSDTVYTIGTLWNRGELVVSTLHRKLQTNPPSGGVAVAGETVVDADLMAAGLAVFQATGPWHGLAAVELKRPEPDAPAFILEINPRMWGFGYLMTLAGLNIPALLVRMLANDPSLDTNAFKSHPAYAPTRMTRTWMDVQIPIDTESAS